MYLKRLEIIGFKSFPDKIKLDFSTGITGVVGPNGSGKSNIADAIRWAIGEQSVKNLRGGKMEDVIFVGTSARRPLGFAEVTIVLDNADKGMKVAFAEVAVTRRVYRSGESQYLINGAMCRLKDIHELFMDTGIGRDGYSIIGQGRVEEILSARGEERRLLFEEAAGIIKYKTRRTEAETKLTRERNNLERVTDIIDELRLQLEPLGAAAEKARIFLKLNERLKLVKINVFLCQTENMEAEMARILENISNVDKQIEDATTNKNRDFVEIQEIKSKLEENSSQQAQLSEDFNQNLSEIRMRESEMRVAEEKINHIELDINRINNEIFDKESLIEKKHENLADFDKLKIEFNEKIKEKEEVAFKKESELDEFSRQLAENELSAEKYAGEHIEKLRVDSEINGKIAREEALYENLELENERIIDGLSEIVSKIKSAEEEKNLAEQECLNLEEKVNLLIDKMQNLENQSETVNSEVQSADTFLQSVLRELSECLSRRKALSDLESNYEGYYKSVKTVLREKKNNPKFNGVCGAVGELAKVDTKFETAIEVALGGTIQNIVVENENDAKMAIELLKRTNSGRATFLPISTINARNFGGEKTRILAEKGVLGIASDLIKCDEKYIAIFANLLGQVIVFDDYDNAVEHCRKTSYRHKCVTVGGELITGGAISGGSAGKSGGNIFSRSREIEDCSAKIVELETSRARAQSIFDEKTNIKKSINELMNKNQLSMQEAKLVQTAAKSKLSRLAVDVDELRTQHSALENTHCESMNAITEKNKYLRTLKNEKLLLEKEISEILAVVDERQRNLTKDRTNKDKLAKLVAEEHLQLEKIRQSLKGVISDCARTETEILTTKKAIESIRKQIDDKNIEKNILLAKIDDLIDEINVFKSNGDEFEKQNVTLVLEQRTFAKRLKELENSNTEIVELLSNLSNEKTRIESKKERQEEENRRIYDEMWELYEITPRAATQYERLDMPIWRLQKESHDLKEEIKGLGSVNVSAIDEFAAIGERCQFITKQRDDIIASEEELLAIIDELNELMQKQFLEQISVISENFSKVFVEMFGGGSASLAISDKKDILNSSIDIVAQMPGKNLKNMSLFSGGERSLTAIALLFSILRIKPSPFCVLDEIEAALDDANVAKFATFLQNINSTQFIVITHRKITMKAADRLYGVTMQEHGVSKLLSVQMEEAKNIG